MGWQQFCGGGKEYKNYKVEGTHMYIMEPLGKTKFCEIISEELKEFL